MGQAGPFATFFLDAQHRNFSNSHRLLYVSVIALATLVMMGSMSNFPYKMPFSVTENKLVLPPSVPPAPHTVSEMQQTCNKYISLANYLEWKKEDENS